MIQFKNVSFSYGMDAEMDSDSNGIHGVNLTINKGEFLVITGGSGCGKTTITRLINGLIPNYYEGKLEGQVYVGKKEVSKLPICDTAKRVGSVFQNPRSQFFNVDTTSELAFASENQGIPVDEIRRRIDKTVEEFQIQSLMGRSIFKLSGGEKQKIACASVSVAETEIIVLDEPSSNLDSEAIEDLKNVLRMWREQGKTVVIAEHRLYFLRELADRMLIMKEGKIVDEIHADRLKSMSLADTEDKGLRPLTIESLELQELDLHKSKSEVTFSGIKFSYKDGGHGVHIDNVSFHENSVVAIIGHNGAGKSTFARCMCGLEKACKGIMNLSDIALSSKGRIQNCYMVMQDVNHQLFTESVLDEVVLSMLDKRTVPEKEKEDKAKKILESLDLEKYADIHPMALSGGQKQRVAIASAIASDRKIILFDEPTSGLDYVHMNQVAENLRNLSKMKKTVFVITHDPELILNCCTDVLHLENGKVEEVYELNRNTEIRLKHFFMDEQQRSTRSA